MTSVADGLIVLNAIGEKKKFKTRENLYFMLQSSRALVYLGIDVVILGDMEWAVLSR